MLTSKTLRHPDVDNLSDSLSEDLFSDRFPVYFYFNSIPVPIFHQNSYSKSSFNAILFNRKVQQVFNFLSRDSCFNFTYPDDWYSLLVTSFVNSFKPKRAIRIKLPPFYSSDTIHLINHKKDLETIRE